MGNIVITTEENLMSVIRNVLEAFESEKKAQRPQKLYTINQVAKMLGKAHGTIKKYVQLGIIKSTKNGLITEDAINVYLNK